MTATAQIPIPSCTAGRIRFRRLENSPALQALLALMRARRDRGEPRVTARDIHTLTPVEAHTAAISELRENGKRLGFTVDSRTEKRNGKTVYTYGVVELGRPVEVVLTHDDIMDTLADDGRADFKLVTEHGNPYAAEQGRLL